MARRCGFSEDKRHLDAKNRSEALSVWSRADLLAIDGHNTLAER